MMIDHRIWEPSRDDDNESYRYESYHKKKKNVHKKNQSYIEDNNFGFIMTYTCIYYTVKHVYDASVCESTKVNACSCGTP